MKSERKYYVAIFVTRKNKLFKEYVTVFVVDGNDFMWGTEPDPDSEYRIEFDWVNACAVNAYLMAIGQQPQIVIK